MNADRQGVAEILLPGLDPLRHLAQGLDGLVADMDLGQRVIVPFHDDLPGLGLVGLLHHHLDKFGLVQACIDQDILALLDVGAATDDQLCVFTQNSFFHFKVLLFSEIEPIVTDFAQTVNDCCIYSQIGL